MKSFLTWTFGIAVVAMVGLFFFNKSTKKSNIEVVHQNVEPVVSKTPSISRDEKTVTKGSRDQASQAPSSLENIVEKKSVASSRMFDEKTPRPSYRPRAESLGQVEALAGTRWKIWKGVSYLPVSQFAEGTVADVAKYKVVESPTANPDLNNFVKGEGVVLYNERSKMVGLMTGIFNVKVSDSSAIQKITQQYNLEVTGSFPEINRYFVTSKNSVFNLERLKTDLEENPLVSNVELEIISGVYEKF